MRVARFVIFAVLASVGGGCWAQNDESLCRGKYPDVWILRPPKTSGAGPLAIMPMENCDFMVAVGRNDGSGTASATAFFSRKGGVRVGGVTLPDGTKLSDDQFWTAATKAELAAVPPVRVGNEVLSVGTALATQPGQGCYFGPVSYNLALSNEPAQPSASKGGASVTILRLLSRARLVRVKDCGYLPDQAVRVRLESLEVLNAWPLADGGFLLNVANEFVLRVDGKLRSRAPEVGHGLFIESVPTELSGSPVDVLLEMPVLRTAASACRAGLDKGTRECNLQGLHDELVRLLVGSGSRKPGSDSNVSR